MTQAKYRKKEFFKGAYYHAYNRGVNKDSVFRDEKDFLYYLDKLRKFKNKYKVDVIAYSLIDNHYHQLLRQMSNIPINRFLLAVNTSYGGYFNKKRKRVGPLMQDRYKQSVIKNDSHFLRMSVYVNCNYEIHGSGRAREYRWSSYPDYLGLRDGVFCNKTRVKSYFKTPEEYEGFCDELIEKFREKKVLEEMEG